jgi:AAA domain
MQRTKTQILQAVDAFKQVTVRHALLEATMDLVIFMLQLSPNVDIVNLVGPTGIGKSLLQTKIIEHFHDEYRGEMLTNPDFVPIIRTHALAAGHRLFDWKGLYRCALHEVGDPFAMTRKAPRGQDLRPTLQFKNSGESRTAAELRIRLEWEFKTRGTRYWIIDEAQHMAFGGRSGQPGDQFDVIKSIAQSANIKLLLAGPHEMEAPLGSSGQLARRSSTVHFRRYQAGSEESLKTFLGVANTLLSHMDIAGHPSVQEAQVLLYTGSAGCVGILKDWLAKAYGCALRDQETKSGAVLTLEHLRQTRLSTKAMRTIMRDIRREEENMVEVVTDKEYERIVLGIAQHPEVPQATKPRRIPDKPSGGRVGERKPTRDPVPTENSDGRPA